MIPVAIISDLTYEDMKRIVNTHVCGKCGGHLNVAWVNGQYRVRCRDLAHNTYKKPGESERDFVNTIDIYKKAMIQDLPPRYLRKVIEAIEMESSNE